MDIKSKVELELEGLKVHEKSFLQSLETLKANQGDSTTIALEEKNLREIVGRIDELGKFKSLAGGAGAAIPSVQ